MPRFFFHVHDNTLAHDAVGSELADLAAAKCEAVKYAETLICDAALHFWNRGEWKMIVTDDKGLVLFELLLVSFDAPSIKPLAAPPVSLNS